MFSLKGRVAVISGASSGLGKQMARGFANAGADLVILARRIEKLEELKNSDINIKPRLRMTSLYYTAALYSALKAKTYIVAGTGNKCEIYVGYFTKGGDSVSDIKVLSDLTVSEVISIGEELKNTNIYVPSSLHPICGSDLSFPKIRLLLNESLKFII